MSQIDDASPHPSAVLDGGWRSRSRVSWGGLLAGVVVAFALQLLFSLAGGAIGFGSVGGNGDSSAETLGVASGLWWIVSSCLALFAGGYVAAWLAHVGRRFGGALHGLVTWGVVTLLSVYLISTAVGNLIEGGFSAISTVAASVGSGVKDAAAPVANSLDVSRATIKQQAEAYLQPASPDPASMSPQDAQTELAKDLADYKQGGDDAPAAKARIIDIMAAQLKISQAEAAKKFDAAKEKADRTLAAAKQKAADAADTASSAAAKGTLALFIDLLLSAIAAAIGGALARDPQRRVAAVDLA